MTVSDTMSKAQDHLRFVFDLLSRQNDSTYIGEAISQLAHSLQAAHLAAQASASEYVAIAALLHDIGQVLPLDAKNGVRSETADIVDENGESVGRVGHELIGEMWLRRNGWPEEVCQLVGAHVMAKRYLSMSPDYYDALSKASCSSLKGQGGPFTPAQAKELERNDPMLANKIALRRFDDGAKVVDRRTRDLEQWWDAACRVYAHKGRPTVDLLPVEIEMMTTTTTNM